MLFRLGGSCYQCSADRRCGMSGLVEQVEFRKVRRPGRCARPSSLNRPQVRATTNRPLSGGREPDLLLSARRVGEADAAIVASQLGSSWRVLGLRLNFAPETLDEIQLSTKSSRGKHLEALCMLKLWSQLPTATVGRLATVLWEMGKHAIAMQLRP